MKVLKITHEEQAQLLQLCRVGREVILAFAPICEIDDVSLMALERLRIKIASADDEYFSSADKFIEGVS